MHNWPEACAFSTVQIIFPQLRISKSHFRSHSWLTQVLIVTKRFAFIQLGLVMEAEVKRDAGEAGHAKFHKAAVAARVFFLPPRVLKTVAIK